MKSVLVIVAAMLLFACSTTRYTWQHPDGFGEVERQSASETCEQLAYAEAPHHFSRWPHPFGLHDHRSWHHPHHIYYPDPYMLRRSLTRVCMRAKGWELVKERDAGDGG